MCATILPRAGLLPMPGGGGRSRHTRPTTAELPLQPGTSERLSEGPNEQARALFAGPTPRWHTSALVGSEAYSWCLRRHGEEPARTCRLFLDNP